MTDMLNEIKVALRGLLKSPGFTAIAIATLALAIGATTAAVSLVNALLVRPLPYHEPSKLVLLWQHFYLQGLERIPVSAPEFPDYKTQAHSFDGIATVALMASYIPALRATRADPVIVLSHNA
jgi:hypothetical protein